MRNNRHRDSSRQKLNASKRDQVLKVEADQDSYGVDEFDLQLGTLPTRKGFISLVACLSRSFSSLRSLQKIFSAIPLMAAVASNHVPEGLRTVEDEPSTESNSSGFTAVNGQAPPGTDGHDAHADIAEEFNARVDPQAGLRQPSPSPSPGTHSRTPPSRQQMETRSLSPAKRKRSYPDEDDNRSNLPYHAHALPPSTHQEKPSLSPSIRMQAQNGRYTNDEQELRHPEPHLQPTNGLIHYEQERPPPFSSQYDPHAQPSTPYYTRPHDDAEARMAEALQRGTQTSHPPHMRADYGSPEDDDGHMQEYGKYSTTQRSSMSGDGKRRKRVFSNRTKTGCLTCRKRKKKCDEAHPECEL